MSAEQASGGLVEQIDAAISNFFSTGNTFTVVLAGVLVVVLIWPILTGKEPDIHPFLLARQAQASQVRQPGESAVFRANEIPIGYPLRTGLAVKDPGAPAWRAGRDGDLRDVWKVAVRGALDEKGNIGSKGRIMTILGKEKVINNDLNDVTKAVNTIGQLIQSKGGKTVAVSLSNSFEFLAVLFASAFYDFKPVLIPYGLDQAQLQTLLGISSPDFLIAEAGSVEIKSVVTAVPSVKNVIWVAKEGSQHLDWNEVPEGIGQLDVSTWHELVAEQKASSEVPEFEAGSQTSNIASFCKMKSGQYELIEYTHANLVAGTGALLSTPIRNHKLTHQDILLPTASLTETYTICWTLAALYTGATVALNSVAGVWVELTAAALSVSPTIIISSSGTISKHHQKIEAYAAGLSQKISNYFQRQNMQSGIMSSKKHSALGSSFSALRLLAISQLDTGSKDSRVSSQVLADLRLALGTRVAYALTSGKVAGAVSTTNILDYRNRGSVINMGAPVGSLELFVRGDEKSMDSDMPEGTIVVSGPSVVGTGKVELETSARVELDRTLTLI